MEIYLFKIQDCHGTAHQRMLITYDGRVSMCCYDWGSMHPVGYVDKLAIETGEKEYENKKGR